MNEKKLLKSMIGYHFILQLMDILTTINFLSKGYTEGNFLFAYIFKFEYGLIIVSIMKITIMFFLLFYFYIKILKMSPKVKRKNLIVMHLLNCFYLFVCFNNIIFTP